MTPELPAGQARQYWTGVACRAGLALTALGLAFAAWAEHRSLLAAREEASRQLPYGNGPPIFGAYRRVSMIQWTQAIDNQRSYFAEELTRICMHDKGFVLVPLTERPSRQ